MTTHTLRRLLIATWILGALGNGTQAQSPEPNFGELTGSPTSTEPTKGAALTSTRTCMSTS